MKIRKSKNTKEGMTFDFQQALLSQNQSKPQDEVADMKSFLKDIETLGLPQIKNQPEIQKIKKRIYTFGKQYGLKTEKTTFIFMNYLETVRQSGVNHLKNKDLLKAASFFAQCLRFIDPKYDEIFYEKFLIVKIDAVNKLMYCLFELQSQRVSELTQQPRQDKSDRYQNAQNILERFLFQIHQFQKIESLKKNENCMLELNYFFLGRLYRKNKRYSNAIKAFQKSQAMILNKLSSKQNIKSETRQFWYNLLAKIYYKRSKCYRDQNDKNDQRIKYEQMALRQANQNGNLKLEYYIRRKIQFYEASQQFKAKLATLETKRQIQHETFRLIEESRQTEINSLYNVYNFQGISNKLR